MNRQRHDTSKIHQSSFTYSYSDNFFWLLHYMVFCKGIFLIPAASKIECTCKLRTLISFRWLILSFYSKCLSYFELMSVIPTRYYCQPIKQRTGAYQLRKHAWIRDVEVFRHRFNPWAIALQTAIYSVAVILVNWLTLGKLPIIDTLLSKYEGWIFTNNLLQLK